ncbi:NADPH-dependent FMN reductase [Nocardioides sp.]|uniref:NADPH-dependent FMN reductase n=1 Tax=Nocardioides sp. TaxID=35761 RepID=UPI0039E4C226
MSRTRAAAELIAERLTGTPPTAVVDVVDLGAGLLGWGDAAVAEAKKTVLEAEALIVASPTFKATYTGLLKLFLDQFGQGELGATRREPTSWPSGSQATW